MKLKDTQVAQAREKRDEAKMLLASNVDPSVHRKYAVLKNATTVGCGALPLR
jgi:hypothetical protein